jgi:hypothetical protein
MKTEVDRRIELVESEIWDVVRDSIEAGTIVRVTEAASRIAAAHGHVMSVAEIAELLVEAAIAGGVPVEVAGLPLTARGSRDRAYVPDIVPPGTAGSGDT